MRRPHSLSRLVHGDGRWRSLTAGTLLLSVVGVLDWLTGPELDFSLFYLMPVGFVSWGLGRRAGYAMSVGSAVVWLCVDRLTGTNTAAPLLAPWNMAGRLLFFSGSVYLLTTWKHAEARLARLVDERTAALGRLGAQLSESEYSERRKLANAMHDAVSQTLSIIKMNLDSAQIATPPDTPLGQRLSTCAVLVDEVIAQSRTLMLDLHPAMLDDLGLVPTLQWYAAEFTRRTGTEMLVSEQGPKRPLPAATTNYLYHAVKELAANAARHGRAATIVVTVRWEAACLRLAIDDDGVGFDPARLADRRPRVGLGLAGIDERIKAAGGTFAVESTPGRGARVILEAPAAGQEADHASARAAG